MNEEDEIKQPNIEEERNLNWIWIVVLIVFVVTGYFLYVKYYNSEKNKKEEVGEVTNLATEKEKTIENWLKNTEILSKSTTSSKTIKVADGIFRMYFMKDSKIMYMDSADGETFKTSKSTGITEDSGKFISNPSVLKKADGDWIMIYEQQPQQKNQGGQPNNPPGVSNQRNLYFAKSQDGMNFRKVGLAVDSSKEDNYFASVPDLVLLPNGSIRMYYVSGGDAIGSAISQDGGVTWTRESGYRMTDMAVDPCVLLKNEGEKERWVMYYAILNPERNSLKKAISEDGLNWKFDQDILERDQREGVIVDPDVIEISENEFIMYFGEAAKANSELNLYNAKYIGNIFD